MSIRFELLHTDGPARLGRLHTSTWHRRDAGVHGRRHAGHGQGADAGPASKRSACRSCSATPIISRCGPATRSSPSWAGCTSFMGWPRPILTDSGGYQVFSLAANLKIDDHAAVFRSHIDGALAGADAGESGAHPGKSRLRHRHVPGRMPARRRHAGRAVAQRRCGRTILWAERCRGRSSPVGPGPVRHRAGRHRRGAAGRCAEALRAMDFPGYALGGFSVGETTEQMLDRLGADRGAFACRQTPLPDGRGPAAGYAAGGGSRHRHVRLRAADAQWPQRSAFTIDGPLRLRNACHKRDPGPLESDCPCPTCRKFSRAYLHHLFLAEEMLGPTLLSLHNVAFYGRLMGLARQAIEERRFSPFCAVHLARLDGKLYDSLFPG